MLAHGMLMAAGGGGVNYADLVKEDGASHLWLLTETSGLSFADNIGTTAGTSVGSPTLAQPGPTSTKSILLNGTSQFWGVKSNIVTSVPFSAEVLIKTSVKGGGIFETSPSVAAGNGANDNQVYLDANGNLVFGVYNAAVRYIQTDKYIADGLWHHIVFSSMSGNTTAFVDGVSVGSVAYSTNFTGNSLQPIFGYARGDWPVSNGSYLSGAFAMPALYPFAMSQSMAAAHAAAALG